MQLTAVATPELRLTEATTMERIGRGTYMPLRFDGQPPAQPQEVEVLEGRVLMEGISDVVQGFQQLRAQRDHTDLAMRLVGFVRTGDTFRAVELLAATSGRVAPLITHHELRDLRAHAGVDLHSVWDLSDYGWDASSSVMAPRT